jgi:hypothetical protein
LSGAQGVEDLRRLQSLFRVVDPVEQRRNIVENLNQKLKPEWAALITCRERQKDWLLF